MIAVGSHAAGRFFSHWFEPKTPGRPHSLPPLFMHLFGVVGAKVPKTSAERDLQVRHGIHLIRVAQQALTAETSGGTIDLFPQTSTVPTMAALASEKSLRPTVASSAAAPVPSGNLLSNVGGVGRMPPPPSSHHQHHHHQHQHHMVQHFGGAQAGVLMGMASPSSPPAPASAIAVVEAAAAATSVAACSRAGAVDVASSSSSSERPLFSAGGFPSHQPQQHPSATAAVAGAPMATTATTVATMSTVSYPSSGSEVYGNGSCQAQGGSTGAAAAPVSDASSAAGVPTGVPTGVSAGVPTAAPAMVLAAPPTLAQAGAAPLFIPTAAEAVAQQPPMKAAGEHHLAAVESTAATAAVAEAAVVAAASAASAAPVVGVALTKQTEPAPQFGFPDPGPTSGGCSAVQWWMSSPTCAWNSQG